MSKILEKEILALTKTVRQAQKAIFNSDAKSTPADHKTMREVEKQIDNKIKELDKYNAEHSSKNEFIISVIIEFDKTGSAVMRPELPGQLVAATAIDALLSTASNIQKMINAKSDDDVLRKSTIKVAELF